MDLKFFTYSTNVSRPYAKRTYPAPYERIVGIKSDYSQAWVPEHDGYSPNDYDRTVTKAKTINLPRTFAFRLLQYFENNYTLIPDLDQPTRTCHHFAQRMLDPNTSEYAGTANEDPSNAAAQKTVREGMPFETSVTLPLGVVGVFGCVSEVSGQCIGYHSVVGMESNPPIQVFGLGGNIGFLPLDITSERTQHMDQLPSAQLYVDNRHIGPSGELVSPFVD